LSLTPDPSPKERDAAVEAVYFLKVVIESEAMQNISVKGLIKIPSIIGVAGEVAE
jgi:hypothetical protein